MKTTVKSEQYEAKAAPKVGDKKFVWVDMEDVLREYDPETCEGPNLENCYDQVLIAESEKSETRGDSGVVRAVFSVDKHWHFDGRLTHAERKTLGLWRNRDEKDRWAAEKAQKAVR